MHLIHWIRTVWKKSCFNENGASWLNSKKCQITKNELEYNLFHDSFVESRFLGSWRSRTGASIGITPVIFYSNNNNQPASPERRTARWETDKWCGCSEPRPITVLIVGEPPAKTPLRTEGGSAGDVEPWRQQKMSLHNKGSWLQQLPWLTIK